MSFQLISASAITALVAGSSFPSVLPARRQQLASQLTAAADELDQVVPFLLSGAASADEANFIRALIGGGSSSSGSGGSGGSGGTTSNSGTGSSDFDGTITSVGTGVAGSLETLATVGIAVPSLRVIYIDDTVEEWLLVAGTENSTAGQFQQPLDFDASTNAKVWVRKG